MESNQSKTMSLVEVCSGTLIGYIVAVCSQILIFPLFNIHIPHSHNLLIALIFTAISLVRGYVVRRLFNSFTKPVDTSIPSSYMSAFSDVRSEAPRDTQPSATSGVQFNASVEYSSVEIPAQDRLSSDGEKEEPLESINLNEKMLEILKDKEKKRQRLENYDN